MPEPDAAHDSTGHAISLVIALTLSIVLIGGICAGVVMAYQGKEVPQWIIGMIIVIPPAFLGWLAPSPQLRGTNTIPTSTVTALMSASSVPALPTAPVPGRPNAGLQPSGTAVLDEPLINMNGETVGTFTGKA